MTPEMRAPIVAVADPPMARVPRAACVLVSLGGLTAGTFATFKSDNELGTSALILIGIYAGMAAILRRFPRFKLGDNEIDPSVIQQARAEGADDVADVVAEAVIEGRDPLEAYMRARSEVIRIKGGESLLLGLPEGSINMFTDDDGVQWVQLLDQDGQVLGRRAKGSEFAWLDKQVE
jgi:hypothetical protein